MSMPTDEAKTTQATDPSLVLLIWTESLVEGSIERAVKLT
jgi:hypothetical protein